MAPYEPEPRTTPRGRSYRKVAGRMTVEVEGPGYKVERHALGAYNPGTWADLLHKRHEDINATFDAVGAIVTGAAHPAQAAIYLRRLEPVRALWHTKGTKWRDAYKAAHLATRRMDFMPAEAKAALRALLLQAEYGGEAWQLLPGTQKSRRRWPELVKRFNDRDAAGLKGA